jgi:hypothetical protein
MNNQDLELLSYLESENDTQIKLFELCKNKKNTKIVKDIKIISSKADNIKNITSSKPIEISIEEVIEPERAIDHNIDRTVKPLKFVKNVGRLPSSSLFKIYYNQDCNLRLFVIE